MERRQKHRNSLPAEEFNCISQITQGKMGGHLMAYLQARWQISVMSAPEKPLVYLTSWARSTSGATGDLRRAALKIWFLLGSSGRGM